MGQEVIAGAMQLCRNEQRGAMADNIPATMSTMPTFSHRDWKKATVLRWPLSPLLALIVIVVFLSCACSSSSARQASPPSRFSEPVPRSSAADNVGRFLSGLPVNDGNDPLKNLESQEAWDIHRRDLSSIWNKVEDGWIPPMREFQRRELSGAPIEKSILFYPFSGPDVLMATVFFPHNPVYVMVGLEPTGTLPTPKQLAREELSRYLAEVRDSVSSELERSFFITREMDREFRGQVTDGLISPILLLLTRTHHTILGHRYVRLDADGHIVERSADYKAPGRIGNKGIEIDFRTDADQSVHKLFYFSVNLSDEWLQKNEPFLTFLGGLKGMVTFFKATSYMPHEPAFSIIRERVLAGSSAILQDDSGIPYHYFDAARWQVQLYGNYERPYGSFRWLEQPDLRKAYAASGPKPLGFRIGYGFSRIPSNLQLARRKR